jgi:hypothetical protein
MENKLHGLSISENFPLTKNINPRKKFTFLGVVMSESEWIEEL